MGRMDQNYLEKLDRLVETGSAGQRIERCDRRRASPRRGRPDHQLQLVIREQACSVVGWLDDPATDEETGGEEGKKKRTSAKHP